MGRRIKDSTLLLLVDLRSAPTRVGDEWPQEKWLAAPTLVGWLVCWPVRTCWEFSRILSICCCGRPRVKSPRADFYPAQNTRYPSLSLLCHVILLLLQWSSTPHWNHGNCAGVGILVNEWGGWEYVRVQGGSTRLRGMWRQGEAFVDAELQLLFCICICVFVYLACHMRRLKCSLEGSSRYDGRLSSSWKHS